MSLLDDIRKYKPFNEQEAVDRRLIMERLEDDPRAFDRDSLAHVTCSAWTVDPLFERTLLVYHRIYDSWSWIGGHADGERDLSVVALRELQEETGVSSGKIAQCGPGDIFSLEVLTVDGHEKRGAYVGSHLHLNVTYLVVADPNERIRVKEDENSGVRWVPLEDAITLSSEPWIRERIYRKLIAKTRAVAADCGQV